MLLFIKLFRSNFYYNDKTNISLRKLDYLNINEKIYFNLKLISTKHSIYCLEFMMPSSHNLLSMFTFSSIMNFQIIFMSRNVKFHNYNAIILYILNLAMIVNFYNIHPFMLSR